MKSFAGAGIVNKVLAIFDNDTAGESAVRTLNQISLPTNIRVMRLPMFEALRQYDSKFFIRILLSHCRKFRGLSVWWNQKVGERGYHEGSGTSLRRRD